MKINEVLDEASFMQMVTPVMFGKHYKKALAELDRLVAEHPTKDPMFLASKVSQYYNNIDAKQLYQSWSKQSVKESASAGATSAGNVAVGVVYKNKKAPKTPKNKDGTAKNALDLKGSNLITGGSVAKR